MPRTPPADAGDRGEAARSFPLLRRRPLASAFRRAAVAIAFEGSFIETVFAVATLLARHNEAEGTVVGCARIGPDGPEAISAELDLTAAASCAEVLKSVRAALEDDPGGDGRDARVFVAALGEPNVGPRPLEAGDLDRLRRSLTSADLDLIVDRPARTLRCGFDLELIDEEGVRRLLDQVVRTVSQARAQPDRPLAELDPLGSAERGALLALSPPSPPPTGRACIHELIEARAVAAPERLAVSFDGARLTYRELERHASQLAGRLREAGVGRGDRVGIRLDRSLDQLIAIHGVLKAGAAYVPIEPNLPPARQRRIAELAGLEVVVEPEGPEPLPGTRRVSVASHEGADRELPPPASEPGDTAYVLFTSGSTGEPKGVAISHEKVTRLFATTRELFSFSADDVWVNAHTFAFDASVWEIFGALLHGGSAVIASRETSRDPEAMIDLVEAESATMLTTTPTAFDGLRDAALEGDRDLSSLRFVVLCAEALNPAALAPWFERWGDEQPQLVNMYGITETTVHSTFHRLSWADARSPRRRIGRGLADTPLHVLDPQQRLVPFGVPGEIYVGGPRVAAGYCAAGEDDQARFMPDPFSASSTARMYRSGDRGRRLPDGTIEYLGRLDQQVKVRGHRIELGEIEHALLDHPAIRSARARAVPRAELPPVLAAYCVPVSGDGGEVPDLREFLAARLPDYMVPVHFLIVDELPLTANGKLDVTKLPDPSAAPKPATDDLGDAASPLEALIAGTMAHVLGLPEVGRGASFFDLGGDSITAVRLVGRLRKEGIAVELPHVYELRTARLLARALEFARAGEAPAVEPFSLLDDGDARWLPAGAVDAYPTIRLQQGLLFHNAIDPNAYHDVLSYTVDGRLEESPFRQALDAVVAAHPVLRTSFVVDGPRVPLQVVHGFADVACAFVDAADAVDREAVLDRWAREERRSPFDWRHAGMLRICVHRWCEGQSTLSISVHHAILDGWSVAMLVTELLLAYARARAGEPPATRPDGHLLRRAVALEQAAESAGEHRRFWRDQLEDAEPTAVAALGAGVAEAADGEVRIEIPADVVDGLRRLARESGVPLKTVYLTAHAALVSYASAKPDVLTGLVTGTRVEEEGGDEALGLFLNTLPFRLEPGEASWATLIRRVFERELAIYRHRRYPFERIRADAQVARLCPTGFNYTDFHVYQDLAGSGLELRGVRYREKTDFQLLVTVSEEPAQHSTGVTVSYDAAVGEAQAERFARLLLELLGLAVSAPGRPVLGTLAARAQAVGLTYELPTATTAEEAESPLARVAAQVRARPTAVAQVGAGEAESFAELGERISRVREALLDRGVEPGARVACFLDRGRDPLVAMLGAWAAGATYVPVDVSLPLARQAKMVELAGCSLAICSARLGRDELAWRGEMLVLDGSLPAAASSPDDWRLPQPGEEAYVLFTSGSTGEPKGVSMPHRGLANLISWQLRQPELAAPRRISQFAALSFDVSIQEMLAAACSGGTLFVVPEQDRPNPQALLEFLASEEIELSFLPVVALQQLALAWEVLQLSPAALRWIVTAGEALIVGDAIRELCRSASIELINQYGPTETHVVTHHRLGGASDRWPQRPPIGLPLANVAVRVLDHAGRPVPHGTAGELYLGGDCVAAGYVDGTGLDPMTGERFVGLDGEDGVLYRTGDIVRGGDDGLEFVGRVDDQVKVRGHRVELGEVSAVLMRHPGVRSCVVRPHETSGGSRSLVAYVVGDGEGTSAAELTGHARSLLPEYAVPAHVELVAELPRTRSGKLDVRALPAPRRPRPSGKAVPLSSTERRVLEVWRQVLGHPVASPTVSFFDAGGDSLMTLRLYGLVRNTFGEELAMHDLFRFPTARSFAAHVDGGRSIALEGARVAAADQIAIAAARNRSARAGRGTDG